MNIVKIGHSPKEVATAFDLTPSENPIFKGKGFPQSGTVNTESLRLQPSNVINISDILKSDFFRRISSREKQLIAMKTEGIQLTPERVLSLKSRKFETDPFYQEHGWIYVALKAFMEGRLDEFEISDLVLYDSLRRSDSFQYHSETKQVAKLLKQGFQEADERVKETERSEPIKHGIKWKEFESFVSGLPEKERHIYVYRHDAVNESSKTIYTESTLYSIGLDHFLPMIRYNDKEYDIIILPPSLLHKLLIHQFGDEVAAPMPVLGFDKNDLLNNANKRVMSLQHPEFTLITDTLHECYVSKPIGQAVYFHDMYHLIVLAANFYRKASIALGNNFPLIMERIPQFKKSPQELRDLILKKGSALLFDQDYYDYLMPDQQGFYTTCTILFDVVFRKILQDHPEWDEQLGDCFLSIVDYVLERVQQEDPDYAGVYIPKRLTEDYFEWSPVIYPPKTSSPKIKDSSKRERSPKIKDSSKRKRSPS